MTMNKEEIAEKYTKILWESWQSRESTKRILCNLINEVLTNQSDIHKEIEQMIAERKPLSASMIPRLDAHNAEMQILKHLQSFPCGEFEEEDWKEAYKIGWTDRDNNEGMSPLVSLTEYRNRQQKEGGK